MTNSDKYWDDLFSDNEQNKKEQSRQDFSLNWQLIICHNG